MAVCYSFLDSGSLKEFPTITCPFMYQYSLTAFSFYWICGLLEVVHGKMFGTSWISMGQQTRLSKVLGTHSILQTLHARKTCSQSSVETVCLQLYR